MLVETLTPLVARLGATPFAQWIGQSTARIYSLFTLHLFGLVLLIGGTIFMSLRLLGFVLANKPVREVGQAATPLIAIGLTVMIASGSLIFIGGAEAYFAGQWFRLKMILLLAAIIYHFAFFRRVSLAAEGQFSELVMGATAIGALLLWFSVGWSGRMIAFS
jgi:uncharacterized membrane protein SirB2